MHNPELILSMTELSPAALLATDASGTIVYANTKGAALFGYAAGELTGKHIGLIVGERLQGDKNALREESTHDAHANSIRFNGRYTGVHQNGSTLPVEVKAEPFRNAEQTFFTWSIRNISAERRLHHKLGERVKEQTALLAVTQLLMGTEDVEQAMCNCLQPVREGWQYPAYTEVCIDIGQQGRYSTPLFEKADRLLRAEIAGRQFPHGTLTVGYRVVDHENPDPVFLAEEERLIAGIARMIGMFLDQREAMRKLQESREQIMRITSHTPANTYMFEMFDDKPMKVHFAMKGFVEHFDDSDMEDLVSDSTKIDGVIHPDDLPRFYDALKKAHAEGSNISVQYRIVNNGAHAWRWLRASPDHLADGRTLWYGSAQDITPIVEYTSVLEQIIFDISHVIRRPVSTMMGITDMLRDDLVLDEKTTRELGRHLKTVAIEMDNYLQKLNTAYLERKVNAAPLHARIAGTA